MQIFQGVYNGKKANALARGLKVLRDVGRREAGRRKVARAAHQQLFGQGDVAGIHNVNGGIPHFFAGNHGALQRAGKLARECDAHHLVARLFCLFELCQKLFRRGLAGGGQVFCLGQHLVKALGFQVQPVAVHFAVDIDLQRNDAQAQRLCLVLREICGGVGDDANHRFPPCNGLCHKVLK